ncbi:hypothetical protein NQ317_004379 [Molorchus minor]|uniref:THAP-type domain-containing protein n=1 Tax=Molorchus minor TaxID=1323400 RepID=A0ABQ9JTM1_9CUCU|nr:hypothetical protein NQ317_004379 [Molorchus minor]
MVVACGSNSARDLVSFFRIPSEYDNHKQFNKLAYERRKAWINRLKRADLTESKIKNGRICSKHFISAPNIEDQNTEDYTMKRGKQEHKRLIHIDRGKSVGSAIARRG